MEALVALGLASNVVQLVLASKEAIELANKLRDKGKDLDILSNSKRIEELCAELSSSTSQSHTKLMATAQACKASATEIQSLIAKIDKSTSTVSRSVRLMKCKSRLEALNQTMRDHQQTIQSLQVHGLWTRADAQQTLLQDSFSSLDRKLQDFVQQSANGQIDLQTLLDSRDQQLVDQLCSMTSAIKDIVASEGQKTRQHASELNKTVLDMVSPNVQKQLLQSLYFDQINARRTQIEAPIAKTFEWVYTAESSDKRSCFRTWALSDERIFWVTGKAGSGKSTFMKFLVTDPRTSNLFNQKYPTHSIYSYFWYNPGASQLLRTQRGMICTILYQMVEENPDMANQILSLRPGFTKHQSIHDWEMRDLYDAFEQAVRSHTTTIVLFVDGLDELDKNENSIELVRFVGTLAMNYNHLKVCVSSRPEKVFQDGFRDASSIRMQDLTHEDLKSVVIELMPGDALHTLKPEAYLKLVDSLLYKAEGVFLWLRLVIKSLQRGLQNQETEAEILSRLGQTPSDLNKLYEQMWDRLGDDTALYKEYAAKCFRTLLLKPDIEMDHMEDITNFHLMLAVDALFYDEVMFQDRDELRDQQILAQLAKTKSEVEVKCAGLLELESTHWVFGGDMEDLPTTKCSKLQGSKPCTGDQDREWQTLQSSSTVSSNHGFDQRQYFCQGEPATHERTGADKRRVFKVSWVHRTARDFLLQTSAGHRLLACDVRTDEEVQHSIFQAAICFYLYSMEYHPANFVERTGFTTLGNIDRSEIHVWNHELDTRLCAALRISSYLDRYLHMHDNGPSSQAIIPVSLSSQRRICDRIGLEHQIRGLQPYLEGGFHPMSDAKWYSFYLEKQVLSTSMLRYGCSCNVLWFPTGVNTARQSLHLNTWRQSVHQDPYWSLLTTMCLFPEAVCVLVSFFPRLLRGELPWKNVRQLLDERLTTIGCAKLISSFIIVEHQNKLGIYNTAYDALCRTSFGKLHRGSKLDFQAQVIVETRFEDEPDERDKKVARSGINEGPLVMRTTEVTRRKHNYVSRVLESNRILLITRLFRRSRMLNVSSSNSMKVEAEQSRGSQHSGDDDVPFEWSHFSPNQKIDPELDNLLDQALTKIYRGYTPGYIEMKQHSIARLLELLIETTKTATVVTDPKECLRSNGHYIPTQEDIEAWQYGKSFEDRANAMSEMNRKNEEFLKEWEAAQRVVNPEELS